MGVTRFGLQIPSFTYPGVEDSDLFGRVAEIAGAAEESGFDSVWVMDHFYQITGVGPRTDPMLEAYTLLGALAARTDRVSLGTMVTGVTYRNRLRRRTSSTNGCDRVPDRPATLGESGT